MMEPEALNKLLLEGWEIEDWSFRTDHPVNGKMPMVVVLNDDMPATHDEETGRKKVAWENTGKIQMILWMTKWIRSNCKNDNRMGCPKIG